MNQQWIVDVINQYGYLGILFLVMIENFFPPIPSEVILIFGGFITTTSRLQVGMVIAVSTLGSLLGAIGLYGLGYLLPPEKFQKFISGKVARRFGLKTKDLGDTREWFKRHGVKAVFFGRFVPLIRSLISVPAGMSKMPLAPFLALTLCGSLIWNSVLIQAGRMAGSAWESVADKAELFSEYGLLALVLLALLALFFTWHKRRSKP